MIKPSFIKAQVAKSAAHRETTSFLRRLVFSVVDTVAQEHYGALYSTKCLQVSAAIRTILDRLGIKSRLWMGAVCVAEVFDEPGHESWGGFWDQDHHVWLATEYHEYVDLGISQCHLHPRRRRQDGLPIPAVWWTDVTRWPPVLRYLPDSSVAIGLGSDDAADLVRFEAKVIAAFDEHVSKRTVQDTVFGQVLSGVDSMNEGFERGDPWSSRAIVFQDGAIPFPDWIQERERELMMLGSRAPSRLAGTLGLKQC